VGSDELRAVFVAASPESEVAGSPALGDDLRARVDAGRAAWPGVALDDATFVRHVAACSAESLPPLKYAADLWLACACATGTKGAVEAFEKEHRTTLERAVSRVSPAMVDEVVQVVFVSLFVADPGARPRIAEYGGRAALKTWLATVASNAALNRVQRVDQRPYDSVGAIGEAAALEPELALARLRHGEALAAALREAVRSLDSRKRVILRLHHAQGWTMDRLATMYRVSRSAAGRLVVDARRALLDDAKRRLRERLDLSDSEVDSLIEVLKSDVQVSILRALDRDEALNE
jgi:RNA polymerase sigma-70 factor (ECF subfamily)